MVQFIGQRFKYNADFCDASILVPTILEFCGSILYQYVPRSISRWIIFCPKKSSPNTFVSHSKCKHCNIAFSGHTLFAIKILCTCKYILFSLKGSKQNQVKSQMLNRTENLLRTDMQELSDSLQRLLYYSIDVYFDEVIIPKWKKCKEISTMHWWAGSSCQRMCR